MTDPLDEIDELILAQVAAVHDLADPPPADLNLRVRFAIRLENSDIEIARLHDDELIGTGARAADRTKTITFDADSLTIMVTISDSGSGHYRIDGWLAPADHLRVELRFSDTLGSGTGRSYETDSDAGGRFVFGAVAPGLAQFTVHRDGGGSVVTPPLML